MTTSYVVVIDYIWILEHCAVYRSIQTSRFINFLPEGRTEVMYKFHFDILWSSSSSTDNKIDLVLKDCWFAQLAQWTEIKMLRLQSTLVENFRLKVLVTWDGCKFSLTRGWHLFIYIYLYFFNLTPLIPWSQCDLNPWFQHNWLFHY